MCRQRIFPEICLLAVAWLLVGSLSAQEPDLEEMNRIFRELARPGPEHEMLARMAGSWDAEMVLWPERGAAPVKTSGTTESRLLLGGRFLYQETGGTGATEPMSIGLLGFDRRSGKYHTLGMDRYGTYWVTASGAPAGEGEPIVLSGEDYDAHFDYRQIYDFVLDWVDADTFTWSIIFKDPFHTKGGPPFKMVEITYRRKSSDAR